MKKLDSTLCLGDFNDILKLPLVLKHPVGWAILLLGNVTFNIRQNASTHFTRTNYGYLNSTIIFVMVIASLMQMSGLEHLDANQKVKIVSANRGNTKVPGSILFCKNQTIDCTYVLLL